MIKIENLSKKFNSKKILNDITIDFQNKTYGLLGENGAGKTTIIRCITGMYSNYTGKITVTDKNKQIGYLPQNFGAFKELTVNDMMLFFANQKGLPIKSAVKEIPNLIELVNLSDKANTKVGKLSGGMVRRLGIAQALLGNPDIIVFDEPTAGLDPEERLRFKNIIEKIKKEKTVIISTHIVEDVDALCDEIAIVKNGRIIECNSTKGIKNIANGKVYEIPEALSYNLTDSYEVVKQFDKDNNLYYRVLTKEFDNNYLVESTIEDGYLCAIKEI